MAKFIVWIIGTLAVLALVVWGIGSFLAVNDLKKCDKPDANNPACAPADVIVVISGGDTPARTQEAVKLYKDGWAPLVIFSGAALDTTGPSNAASMRAQAVASGVPLKATDIEEDALDTTQNARYTKKLITNERRIILVTSPYHQRRASLEFKQVFGNEFTILSRPTPNDRIWQNWWFTSTGWWLALSETVKTFITML